jgi:ATP phosphoribosyltransferase
MTTLPRIGLPKGRLTEQAIDLLSRAGIHTDREAVSRRLTFPDSRGRFELVSLKPVDIPVYVASGALDAGIVGSDILQEVDADVLEPLDLRIGLCRMVLAAPAGRTLSFENHVRVATKYPRTAERFFWSRQSHIEIVRLEGSVEIAPLLGLADAIVDLVETGRTLRENGLVVLDEVERVSAKLIVNRTAMKTRAAVLHSLIADLDTVIYANP